MSQLPAQALDNLKFLLGEAQRMEAGRLALFPGESSKVPKMIYRGGVPTKKFLKINRQWIKDGKTSVYLGDKYFDPVKRTFKNKPSSVRKLKALRLVGSVATASITNSATTSYSNQVKNDLIRLKNGAANGQVFKMKVNMKKMTFNQLAELIMQFAPNTKLTASTLVGSQLIALNADTLLKLQDLNKLVREEDGGSDTIFISNIFKNDGVIEITNLADNTDNVNQGAFFPFTHNTKLRLERYGIYKDAKSVKSSHNCLVQALEKGGLCKEKLERVKHYTKGGMIATNKIRTIAEMLGITIVIRKMRTNAERKKGVKKTRTWRWGSGDQEFQLGLIENHYFLIDRDVSCTLFALQHYEKIKDEYQWNNVVEFRESKDKTKLLLKRDNKRSRDSFDIIAALVERKDVLLTPIPFDVMCTTPYFRTDMETDNLVEIAKGEYKVNKVNSTDRSTAMLVWFDVEADTTGEKHRPFLIRAKTEQGIKRKFYGENCAKEFVNWLSRIKTIRKPGIEEKYYNEILLIAHNARYDFSFIWEHLTFFGQDMPLMDGQKLIGGSARAYWGKNWRFNTIHFQDSYKLISEALRKFPSMFGLESKKEIMPYSIFTLVNLHNGMTMEDASKAKELNKPQDLELFLANCNNWGCVKEDGTFDMMKYADIYCDYDVEILSDGWLKFREMIKEVCGLDIRNYLTAASVAHDFMIKEGAYDGCNQISGIPRAFIQKCVIGGRTMTRDNKMGFVEKEVADLDAVSNYPSAMVRMPGILKGLPKLIQPQQLNEDFLFQQDGFFVKVRCLNNPSFNLSFPLMSGKDENDIRQYHNDTKDRTYYLDKEGYKQAQEHQDLKFEILCGYYYDEGRNPTIKSTIQQLFDERLLKKNRIVKYGEELGKTKRFSKEHILDGTRAKFIRKCEKAGTPFKAVVNPLQEIYKLLMNSAYGKSMLRPSDTDQRIVPAEKYDSFVSKNYNFIKEIYKLNPGSYLIKMVKTINTHFNNCYFGVEVLSYAKSIMNEVMVLAEKNGIEIYYTDTDSMHIEYAGVEKVYRLFRSKYGRELEGKDLGQFHVDFSLKENGKSAETDSIRSIRSYYLGKKCYIDELTGKTIDGEDVHGYHIRMKGSPRDSIDYVYGKYFGGDVMALYQHLYENKPQAFDLLCGGSSFRPAYEGFNVKSLGYFKTDDEGNKYSCEYDELNCQSEFERIIQFTSPKWC